MFKEGFEQYLIVGDQEGPVNLVGIEIGNEVYRNKTWRIFSLHENVSHQEKFQTEFDKNFVERTKNFIKRI